MLCFNANVRCNFAKMVKLTNDEDCLIYSVYIKKYCSNSEKN